MQHTLRNPADHVFAVYIDERNKQQLDVMNIKSASNQNSGGDQVFLMGSFTEGEGHWWSPTRCRPPSRILCCSSCPLKAIRLQHVMTVIIVHLR